MSSPRPLEPDQPERIGAYRLVSVLGEGGQGTVYRAESPSGAQVVIKVLHAGMSADEGARRRFVREMEIASQVATFCTATVIDIGVFRERPYIVSEYIPGSSLYQLVQSEGPRTGSGLERLAVATLTALGAIHRAGIVHRDFKPANVIMGPEGPVVIDFGIAQLLDQASARSGIVGTPAYMAPEQFEGRIASPASDVFSWAVTMVFAATGRLAFPGATSAAVIHAIMTREPDLRGIPDPLQPLMLSCLAKDPHLRPAPQELLARLTTKARSPQRGPWASAAPPPDTPRADVTPAHRTAHNAYAVGPVTAGTADAPASGAPATAEREGWPGGFVSDPRIVSEPTAPVRLRRRILLIATTTGVALLATGIGIGFAVVGRSDEGNTGLTVSASTSVSADAHPTIVKPSDKHRLAVNVPASTPVSPKPRTTTRPSPSGTTPRPTTAPSASPKPTKTKRSSPVVSEPPVQPESPKTTSQPPPSGNSTLNSSTNYAWARGSVSWNGTTATANGGLQDTMQYESRSWLRIAYKVNVDGSWKQRYAQPDPFVEVSNGEYKDFAFSVGGPVKDVQWDVCSHRNSTTYCTGWK